VELVLNQVENKLCRDLNLKKKHSNILNAVVW